MKITVVADKEGNVLGTYRQEGKAHAEGPTFRLIAGPNQSLHELDLPAEYENVASPHELHRRLGQYLKNAKKS